MNIQVRVLSAGAQAQIRALQSEVAMLNKQLAVAGAASAIGDGRQLSALSKYGNQLQWTGRQLQYNFTLPLAIAGAAATHFALENEKAFTRIKKVYGDASMSSQLLQNELNSLQKAFVALSNHYGVQQSEVLNMAADWAAAGASGIALARGVEQTLRTMVLGEMAAAEATEALIAIQAQYNLSSTELAETIAKLNVIENQTGISLQGLVQGFARAAGVARNAGVDVEHLGAMLAALTPVAGSAAQAGNALKTIISRLLSPTGEAVEILGAMGVNINDLAWKSANGTQKIEVLAKKFHGLSDAQKGVVSATLASRYQINKFDALMDSVYKSVDNNANTVGYYGRALDATASRVEYLKQAEEELQAVLESNPQKLKQIWVILQNAMADIIVPLIPLILLAADAIRRMVEAFRSLPPEVQKAITIGLVFLALFGPLIRYIGSTMTLIGELAWFFGGLGKAVLSVFAPFKAFGGILSGLGAAYLALRARMLGVFAVLISGSATVGRVLAATFGMQTASRIFALNAALVGATRMISAAIIATFINVVPIVFMALTRISAMVRVFAIAIPVIFAEMRFAVLALWRGFGALLYAASYTAVFMAGVAWRAALTIITAIQVAWNFGMLALWRALRIGMMIISVEMWVAIRMIWVRGLAAIQMVLLAFAAFAGGIWRAMLAGIGAMTLLFGANLKKFFLQLIPMIRAASLAIMAAMTGPWGIAIAVVIGLLILFHKQIGQLIGNIIDYFRNLPAGVGEALSPLVSIFHAAVRAVMRGFNALPEGVRNALLAVVRIVAAAARQVYELFSYLNPFAHHSPSLVENVTNGMAEVKKQFASVTSISGPIRQAYQDIKRFGLATAALAKMMESAKRGDDRALIGKFAPGALDEYDALIRDLKVLVPLMNQLNDQVKQQQIVVNGLKTQLDAANAALDVQVDKLDKLKEAASSAQSSLDEAQQTLQDWANTPIQGMQAMSDKIFENEMAQKSLRLEMLKMGDAVGGIDDLQERMSRLSGEIELLSGEQNALREGGAGSEILSQYDDQINGLKGQQDSIKDTVSEYEKLSDELDKLQRHGEILDLENSLAFDPLTRQIEQAANAMQEMPFDEIMAGMAQAQADVAKYTVEVEKANAAVEEQQKNVDAATAARDAIQAQYDLESAKLDQLRDKYSQVEEAVRDINTALSDMTQAAEDAIRRQQEALDKAKGGAGGGGGSPALGNFKAGAGGDFPDVGGAGGLGRDGGMGDQSSLIDKFTQDLAKETGDMLGMFDIFGPIKKKWGELKGWFSANVGPVFGVIGDAFQQWFGGIDWTGPFKGIDWKGVFGNIGEMVRDAFRTAAEWGKNIWKLFSDDIKKIWEIIQEKFAKAMDEIGPELAKFKDLVKPATEAMQTMWSVGKVVLGLIGGALLLAFKLIASVLSNILGPALDMIIGVIKGLINIVRGVVQIIIGIFTGDLGMMADGVKSIFSGLVEGIWSILKGAVLIVWGVVKGLVEGIVDFFKWLYDVLVGHSIVPDMVKEIIEWIGSLPGKAWSALKDLGSKIIDQVKKAWDWWTKTNTEVWSKILSWLGSLPQASWNALRELAAKWKARATEALDAFKKTASDKWNQFLSWVKTLGQATYNAALDIVTKWRSRANEAFDAFKSAASAKWNQITGWIRTLPGSAGSAIAGIVGTMKSKATEAMSSLLNGFTGGWGKNNSWLKGLGSRIKSAVGGLGSLLYGIGQSILQGLLNGLKDKWEDVKGFVSGVGPWIKDHKGPIEKDRKLLTNEGAAIMMSLEGGLRTQWPSLQRFVKSVAPGITDAIRNSMGTGGLGAIKSPALDRMAARINHAEARAGAAERASSAIGYGGDSRTVEIHIHGNLEFPNIKSGDDAERFIGNLESLAGGNG